MGELKTDGDNNGENFESTDEIDEENKGEIEEIENEVGAEIQIIRPHAPIDGDKNGENFECTDEIDEENKGEIEEMENELGAKIKEIRPHVPIPNYNSYDNKMRPEPADKNTYDNNEENFESAVTVSHEDNLNIKEKQKIKKLEAEQNAIEDGKLVHEKKD